MWVLHHTIFKQRILHFLILQVVSSKDRGLSSSFAKWESACITTWNWRLTVSPIYWKILCVKTFLKVCPIVIRNIASCSSTLTILKQFNKSLSKHVTWSKKTCFCIRKVLQQLIWELLFNIFTNHAWPCNLELYID